MENISITLVLVVMTGLVSYQAFSKPEMRSKLLLHPYTVKHNSEWFRLLSHGFIHADWGHLFINLFVLYQFGEVVESFFAVIFGPVISPVAYILFYLSAIVISSLPDYFRQADNPGYGALGASGATSAMVFVYVLIDPWAWFLFPPMPAILFGVGYLWYSNYMDKKQQDNIGHNAHFWGAVYGLVFSIISVMAFRPELMEIIWFRLLQGPSAPPFLQ